MRADHLIEFVVVGGIFCAVAILFRGLSSTRWTCQKAAETLTNAKFFFFDGIVVAPFLAATSLIVSSIIPQISAAQYYGIPTVVQFTAAVFLSDFAGYWRHRLLHTSTLWPSHAIHHSDREVQWLTLVRIHPIERLVTLVFDSAVLSLIGFSAEIVVANNLLRHYYGYVLHADVRGRLGVLRYVFVTPHFHRWHHSSLAGARDKNFAVVFSFLDLTFRTFYCPEKAPESLGVNGMEEKNGFVSLMLHPFRSWISAWRGNSAPSKVTAEIHGN